MLIVRAQQNRAIGSQKKSMSINFKLVIAIATAARQLRLEEKLLATSRKHHLVSLLEHIYLPRASWRSLEGSSFCSALLSTVFKWPAGATPSNCLAFTSFM